MNNNREIGFQTNLQMKSDRTGEEYHMGNISIQTQDISNWQGLVYEIASKINERYEKNNDPRRVNLNRIQIVAKYAQKTYTNKNPARNIEEDIFSHYDIKSSKTLSFDCEFINITLDNEQKNTNNSNTNNNNSVNNNNNKQKTTFFNGGAQITISSNNEDLLDTFDIFNKISDLKLNEMHFSLCIQAELDNLKEEIKTSLNSYVGTKITKWSDATKRKLQEIKSVTEKMESLTDFTQAKSVLYGLVKGKRAKSFKSASEGLFMRAEEIYQKLEKAEQNARKSEMYQTLENVAVEMLKNKLDEVVSEHCNIISFYDEFFPVIGNEPKGLDECLSKIKLYQDWMPSIEESLSLPSPMDSLLLSAEKLQAAERDFFENIDNPAFHKEYETAAQNHLAEIEKQLQNAIKNRYQVPSYEAFKLIIENEDDPCKRLKTLMGEEGYLNFIDVEFSHLKIQQSTSKIQIEINNTKKNEDKKKPSFFNKLFGNKKDNGDEEPTVNKRLSYSSDDEKL